MGEKEQTTKQSVEELRELRRKRRIKNQVLAYIVAILFVIAIAAGICFAVMKMTSGKNPEPVPTVSSSEETSEESSEEIPESTEESSEPEESVEIIEIEPTHEEKLAVLVKNTIQGMTLEEKVAGLFIVTPEAITGVDVATKAGEGTKTALEKYPVGGLIYFAKNIKNEEQFREMVDNTRNYSKYDLFLTVDEEGGSVSRLANAGVATKTSSPAKIGEAGDYEAAKQMGVTLGGNLTKFGMNLDLAPVADVKSDKKSFIGDRSFGADAQVVGDMASAVAQGLKEVGVSSCVKHFPGVGSTAQDPHKGIATTDLTEEQFRNGEFLSFGKVIDSGVTMVMISNMAAPGLTGNNEPCVFSEKLIDMLRADLKFNGIVISDAMSMGAVSEYYGADEAAIMAIKAGCDMILMPEDFEKAYESVIQAVVNGTISEERINDSLTRIFSVKLDYKVQ